MSPAILLLALPLLTLLGSSAGAAPIIRAEPDELWSVSFDENEVPGKWRVTFGRNGYFVVQHLGAYSQLPVERFAGRVVRIYPGFSQTLLPEEQKGLLSLSHMSLMGSC